jgi:site-specific recombinase
MPTTHSLPDLLTRLDAQAPAVQRHLWLVDFSDWLRGDGSSVPATLARLGLFLDALQGQPDTHRRFQAWWQALVHTVDSTTLLADHGFTSRHAFWSELADRIRLKLLPATPETRDATELFALVLSDPFDAQWLAALDGPLLTRVTALLQPPAPDAQHATNAATLPHWHHTLLQAITYCTSQVCATGFAPELRLRLQDSARAAEPFHALSADAMAFREALVASHATAPGDRAAEAEAQEALQRSLKQFRDRLEACRHAAATVYTHLDEHGISVNLVFRLRQLRERVLRIRALLDCLVASQVSQGSSTATSTVRLMVHLVTVGEERRSVRALIAANSSMLAAKVAERSSEVGEHYITRDAVQYHDMLRKAAGGGALTALTTLMKFAIVALGLSAFWTGFWAGLAYAGSFITIQLLHFTLATKQPAMTAPAMAAKLKDITEPAALDAFVDEVTHLVRSQVAAVLGNVAVVFPAVLAVSGLLQILTGQPMIDAKNAEHVFHSLTLLGPTLIFAAFTGVLLFASSIIAGWTENWFVLHRLDSALRYNPRITALLGPERAASWALFFRSNISGLAANVSLGFMLGLVPAFAGFFGLGLDVRHVTLSAGQLAAACAAIGWEVWREPALWWAVASIPVIGALNLGVSFYCAFRLAVRAHNVTRLDRSRINSAVWARLRTQPLSFFWPARDTAAPGATPHG